MKKQKNFDVKEFFKQSHLAATSAYGVAFTGSSGSGKTTSMVDFLDQFGAQFIYSNIGAVQSSKIRMEIIPVYLEKDYHENACLVIHKKSYANHDLVIQEFLSSLSEKIVAAKDNFDESDAQDIVKKTLAPDNRIYDITGYCSGDMTKQLEKAVLDAAYFVVRANQSQKDLISEIESQKQQEISRNPNTKFDKKKAIKTEVDKRVNNLTLSDYGFYRIIENIFKDMKNCIFEKISQLSDYLDVEYSTDNEEIVIYINQQNGAYSDSLFKYLFEKDGKDLVISHLTFLAPMSDALIEVLYNEFKFGSLSRPIFKLYDLKGLEDGKNSIDETIMKIRESWPDLIFAYQRTDIPSGDFMNYLKRVQDEIPQVPVQLVLTHVDESIQKHLRNLLKCYGALPKGAEGYDEFRESKIQEAYEKVCSECECYIDTLKSRKFKMCALIDEKIQDIDQVLGAEKALYKPKQIMQDIAEFCKSEQSIYRTLPGIDLDIIQSIQIQFNEERLSTIVEQFVELHMNQCDKEYLSQKNLLPHWNTVYKWRSCHRVGSGWTSSAKVYSNISIYIGNSISGFLNRKNIVDAIDIVTEKGDEDIKEKIKNIFRDNIVMDMNSYNGFFSHLKVGLTYGGLMSNFEQTYFSNALDCIANHLNNKDYVMRVMTETLESYKKIWFDRTFRYSEMNV